MTGRRRRPTGVLIAVVVVTGLTLSAPAVADVPLPATSASLTTTSDPGDRVGQGRPSSTTTPTARFTVLQQGRSDRVDLSITPAEGGRELWHVVLAGPARVPLAVGTYAGARRVTDSGGPALLVDPADQTCYDVEGSFTIHEVTWAYGYLERLRATFEQRCVDNMGSDGALRGELVVTNPPRPPDIGVNGLDVPTQGTIEADGAATLAGTVTCSAAATVRLFVTLGRYEPEPVGAAVIPSLECGPEPTTWTVRITAPMGPYTGGGLWGLRVEADAVDPYRLSVSNATFHGDVNLARRPATTVSAAPSVAPVEPDTSSVAATESADASPEGPPPAIAGSSSLESPAAPPLVATAGPVRLRSLLTAGTGPRRALLARLVPPGRRALAHRDVAGRAAVRRRT